MWSTCQSGCERLGDSIAAFTRKCGSHFGRRAWELAENSGPSMEHATSARPVRLGQDLGVLPTPGRGGGSEGSCLCCALSVHHARAQLVLIRFRRSPPWHPHATALRSRPARRRLLGAQGSSEIQGVFTLRIFAGNGSEAWALGGCKAQRCSTRFRQSPAGG